MANSGSVSVTVTKWDTLKFSWETTSQSVEGNTSSVKWIMQLITTGYGRIDSTADKDWSVTINGRSWSGKNRIGVGNNSTKHLASGTITIEHNDDGTKEFSFSFSQEFDIKFASSHISTIKGSGKGTLNTIARASQPSCITWPEHTQNVGYFGDTIAIHMNRKSSDFTHTVRYQFGSASGTIATNVGTATEWQIPLTLMDLIPKTTSGSGTIYVDTYNGTTKIGTKSCGFTATVPASVKPTCTITLDDVTGTDDIYGSPVRSLSKIKATINPKLAYSSPIAAYSITIDGTTYSVAEVTTDVLKNAGTSRVSVSVKDSRGRTGTAYYDMTVLDYVFPVISKLTVRRCEEDGGENDQGDYAQVTISAAITSLSKKNTASYVLKYKKSSSTTWTSVTLSALASTYTVTNYTYIFPADGNSSYDVELTIADRHDTATRSTTLSTAFTLMNWGANGTSMGIGKVAEKSNSLEIGLRAYDQYGMHISNGMSLYGGADNPIDADTSLEHLILTSLNTPTSTLWYVETIFYSTKLVTSDRRQIAMPYRRGGSCWSRYYTGGAWSAWESDALAAYPVGSIYIAYNHTDPKTLFGGTWTRIQNAFLWATTSTGTIGQTGGAQTVALTVDQLPSHSHGSVYSQHAEGTKSQAWYTTAGSSLAYGAVATGGGEAHNNMPPYIQVSIWRRTA